MVRQCKCRSTRTANAGEGQAGAGGGAGGGAGKARARAADGGRGARAGVPRTSPALFRAPAPATPPAPASPRLALPGLAVSRMEPPQAGHEHRGVLNDPFDCILGRSAAAEAMRAFGRRAATVDAPVLLLGESGTGKGVLARAIHEASARARHAFVAVNCAAIPDALFESEFFGHVRGAFTGAQYAHKGLLEQADGGTLFLDEVAELSLPAQAKLLTSIEDRQVRRVGGERQLALDPRIIAAAASDLHDDVVNRRFRRDLYHRLRVLHFTIAPLRERHGDILLLATAFAEKYAQRYRREPVSLGPTASALLETWSWPGNVRELAHAVEAALLACDGCSIDTIILEPLGRRDEPSPEDSFLFLRKQRYSYSGNATEERRLIDMAIAKCRGNKTRAAAELGMSRNTLLNKLRKFGLSA